MKLANEKNKSVAPHRGGAATNIAALFDQEEEKDSNTTRILGPRGGKRAMGESSWSVGQPFWFAKKNHNSVTAKKPAVP